VRVDGKDLRVSASAGVASILANDSEKDVVGRTDEALYASKKAGRNCGHLNDGHSNHLIKLEELLAPDAAATPGSEKLGDEWMFEAEAATESSAREPLPQVSNRPVFFDDLIRRLAQWRRGNATLTLMLVQIDALSRIVSDHGMSAGDVGLGEDTFALLLPGALLSDGVAIAERLRHAVERCRLPRKAGTNFFTISVGVVEASDGDDLRRLLQRARGALHTAVNQGRNCVVGRDALGAQVREATAGKTPVAALST
jgi:diguanylate cyclase